MKATLRIEKLGGFNGLTGIQRPITDMCEATEYLRGFFDGVAMVVPDMEKEKFKITMCVNMSE